MDKIKTTVTLAGQRFNVTGDSDEQHIRAIEQLVNSRIEDIAKAYPKIEIRNCILYAMFNLAEDYLKLKASTEQIDAKLAQLRGSMTTRIVRSSATENDQHSKPDA